MATVAGVQPQMAGEVQGAYASRYSSRVAELCAFAREAYAIEPEWMKLIAACLVPAYPYKQPWLICDSKPHPFWDDLSKAMTAFGYPPVRDISTMRPRRLTDDRQVDEAYVFRLDRIREASPYISYDSGVDRPYSRYMLPDHPYWGLTAMTVRAYMPIEMKRLTTDDEWKELARLLELTMDRNNRRLLPSPVNVPLKVRDLVERIHAINVDVDLDRRMMENLAMIPSSHAALVGRTELIKEDWDQLRFVVGSLMKPWYRHLFGWYWTRVYDPNASGIPLWKRRFKLPNRTTWRRILIPAMVGRRQTRERWIDKLTSGDIVYVPRRISGREETGQRWDLTENGEMLMRLIFDPEFEITDKPDTDN